MATADQKEDVVLASFATLSILQLIKDAQQKHGLRHGDYQRYRGYCARRVKRIRKSLGYSHIHKSVPKHPAKFSQRKIVFDVVSEERYLQVAVFDAERDWSYAMQLKQEAGEDAHSRKRFHMISRLRKAVKHASNLESIVRICDRADAATKLEAQAYKAWMTGCLYFELKQWKSALEFLKTAKTIYKKLAGVVKLPDLICLYEARCREIQPQIRYCEFNCGLDTTTDEAMSEMISMRLKLGGEEGALQDDFDKLIAEMRTKATVDHEQMVVWAGEKVPVTGDVVRRVVQAVDHFDAELENTAAHDDKIALYERLLSSTRDAIQNVNDEQKKTSGVVRSGDGPLSPADVILGYLDFVRLSKTIERYVLIIKQTRSQTEKKPKPQDLVRLYDSVIENCNEILQIPGVLKDSTIKSAFQAKIDYYRAFRCFFMAEAYAGLSRYKEAAALYERALERCDAGQKTMRSVGQNTYLRENEEDLKELAEQVTAAKYAARANRLAEAAGKIKEGEEVSSDDSRPLIETLDEYRKIRPEDLLKADSNVCVVPMPPPFIPMPNKPIFFDLALNHIKMPDLEAKIAAFGGEKKVPHNQLENTKRNKEAKGAQKPAEEEQQGIGGLVKGWFWGKK